MFLKRFRPTDTIYCVMKSCQWGLGFYTRGYGYNSCVGRTLVIHLLRVKLIITKFDPVMITKFYHSSGGACEKWSPGQKV